MAGFSYRYRISGGMPTVQNLLCTNTATLTKGDIVTVAAGKVALAATGDTTLAGLVLETKAGTAATTRYEVITDPDVVYGVADANARVVGATLDIAGATGAQAVAASSNKEFVVVADSSASQETLVRLNVGKHYQNKAL